MGEYRVGRAWGIAGIYFIINLTIGWLTGIFPKLTPLATVEQLSNPRWLIFTGACLVVILVGYFVVWPMGTLTHGRSLNWLAVIPFGLMWGVGQGLLFVSVWSLIDGWVDSVWLTVLLTFLLLGTFIGLWHSQFWDIYVSPIHNIEEWNGRKVLFVHTPNLILTLTYLTLWRNAGIFILLQTLALLGSTYFMRFPPFWQKNRA